jgi:hypothetical protein
MIKYLDPRWLQWKSKTTGLREKTDETNMVLIHAYALCWWVTVIGRAKLTISEHREEYLGVGQLAFRWTGQ